MKLSRLISAIAVFSTSLLLIQPGTQVVQAAPAVTRTEKTVIVTENQINNSYWITHPIRRSVSNKHVSLNGDGTVLITATITGTNGVVHNAQAIWKPYISRGVLIFNFQSATVDGKPANNAERYELRSAHQTIVRAAIRDYVRSQVGSVFVYKSIAITQGQIAVTVWSYTKS
jgi:hypothetical protein